MNIGQISVLNMRQYDTTPDICYGMIYAMAQTVDEC